MVALYLFIFTDQPVHIEIEKNRVTPLAPPGLPREKSPYWLKLVEVIPEINVENKDYWEQ